MSETPLGIRRGPVMFGQDNEYVYRELLGYSVEEYAALKQQGTSERTTRQGLANQAHLDPQVTYRSRTICSNCR